MLFCFIEAIEAVNGGAMKRKIHFRQSRRIKSVLLAGVGIFLAGRLLLFALPSLHALGVSVCRYAGKVLCQTVLLEEKPVLRYLFYEEEKRDVFRFFSNQLLGMRGQLVCAAMDYEAEEGIFVQDVEPMEILTADSALLEGVLSENENAEQGYLLVSYAECGSIKKQGEKEGTEQPTQRGEGDEGKDEKEEDGEETGLAQNGEGDELTAEGAQESQETAAMTKPVADVAAILADNYSLEALATADALLSEYYIVDSVTSTLPSLFQAKELLAQDLSVEKTTEGYQVLIYHTHGTEGYCDSRSGEVMDTVRGPGEALAEYLRERGYTVYHDMNAYDWKDGKDNRNYAYSTAAPAIEAYLAEHPETEIIIDLHRDSGAKRVSEVNGKQTARVMLFNGLCRNASGPIDYLQNPNLSTNLAFSLQVNLVGRVLYPGLMHKIYLKNYRYNQHFCGRYLLIELGTEQNTLEEAYNAMEPLAEVLDVVLSRKK